MTQNASEFVGDIPDNYDRGLGPVIFADYAADIANRASAVQPGTVLELAAGTGIVSRALRDQLPDSTQLEITDLNPPMLEIARSKFEPGEAVSFTDANAMNLPYADDRFDLIVCQFGVMFFPDKTTSFREALRVLKPGGTYLLSTWGTMNDNPFSQIAQDVAAAFFPDNVPGFYRVPFSDGDPGKIIADLRAGGFSQVTHTPIALQKQVGDFAAFAHGLVFGNPLIDEIKQRGGVDPSEVVDTLAQRFRAEWGDEPAPIPLLAHVFSAT